MNKYKVRVYEVGASGFFTQADNYKDFEIQTEETHEQVVQRLAVNGLRDGKKWYMPGAIVWVEQKS